MRAGNLESVSLVALIVMSFPHPPLALFLIIASLTTAFGQTPRPVPKDAPPIVAAPPGVMIDFYPVSTTPQKGGRYINTRQLPHIGYVAAAPALQIERLRSVKKIHTNMRTTIQSADGKNRTASNTVPAVEMSLSNADASAIASLMEKSVGQRIYIEAQGQGIYAPLVRTPQRTTTLTFSLADDAELEDAYQNLARFVKK
jgi:hypothetical protein